MNAEDDLSPDLAAILQDEGVGTLNYMVGVANGPRRLLMPTRDRIERRLRAHRCADHAPAGLPDPITAAEAAELPDDAIVVPATSETDPTPRIGKATYHVGSVRRCHMANIGAWWTVLYRPAPPPEPLGVGDTVRTAPDLARVPVGAALRSADGRLAERWLLDDAPAVCFVADQLAELWGDIAENRKPLRIIDIPEETS